MCNIYKIEEISTKNANEHFIIDESEFTSLNGEQILVCGIINSLNKYYRVEVITRNIIESHGWGGYNWLNANNSGYRHKFHAHGSHNFGFGLESTSHFESL